MDVIAIREAAYQSWRQHPWKPYPLEHVWMQVLVARAFTEGYMACWGEYREIILKDQQCTRVT